MSLTGLTVFDNTIHTTNAWLKELMDQLRWEDRQRAYHALRTGLHALRDQLTVEAAVALGAQLPMLIRGFYYESWHLGTRPPRERNKAVFLDHIAAGFHAEEHVAPERIAQAVFELLAEHLAPGEIQRVKQALPNELRSLWS
jgi:uncharacterized protein (DUF2267 family)